MLPDQRRALVPGRTAVRDHHGTLWTVVRCYCQKITKAHYCEVRCVRPAATMRGIDVGDVASLPLCVLELAKD